MPNLTKRTVDAAKPNDREFFVWDDAIKGFGLRVTPKGAKSFVYFYRAGHGRRAPSRKPTIGRYGDITVDTARHIAKEWAALVAQGGDPSKARQELAASPTLQQLFDDYLERYAKPQKREKSWRQDQANFQRHVSNSLKRRFVAEVTGRDIEDIHRAMAATPYAANRMLALLSTMFNLAVKWRWRTDNPCKGVSRNQEHRRERMMTPEELRTFLAALQNYETNATRKSLAKSVVNALRLLLLTGARRNEVLSATWDQFNLSEGIWIKPSSHTKQRKTHRIPLSAPAVALLTAMQENRCDSRYLFPAHRGDSGHMRDPRSSWNTIRSNAGLSDFRIHDLRHSFASFLASSGQSLPIIGALLGHTQAQTTARYAHLLDDPLRAATARVGMIVDRQGEASQDDSCVIGFNQ